MDKTDKIYVAGHSGLLGSAIVRSLRAQGYVNILVQTRSELNLQDGTAVRQFFDQEKPDIVIDCAAKVGGVQAKLDYPVEFLLENLTIQNNLLSAARAVSSKKFVFVSSSCIYPVDSPQPIKEEYAMGGKLDPVNEAYAYAKICGMKLCEYISQEDSLTFISCTPTNIFGIGDHFEPQSAHVIPSLIRRMHEAKTAQDTSLSIRGSSTTRREFLYVDDAADAILWLASNYSGATALNIGTGTDISIIELAERIKALVGFTGELTFDTDAPGGVPQRLLDVSKLHDTGWKHTTTLEDGLERTYRWYLENVSA